MHNPQSALHTCRAYLHTLCPWRGPTFADIEASEQLSFRSVRWMKLNLALSQSGLHRGIDHLFLHCQADVGLLW